MPIDDSTIEELAAAPQSVETDGVKVVERSVSELIELQKYQAAKEAASTRRRGVGITKIISRGDT